MSVNVVIFTGTSNAEWSRAIGAYRIATELRKHNYTVQVIDALPWIIEKDLETFKKLVDKFVGDDTLWVGFSSTFFLNRRAIRRNYSSIKKSDQRNQFDTGGLPVDDDVLPDIRQLILNNNPKCKLVLGGSKASYRRGKIIDIYVEGFADTSVVKMTQWIEGKNPFFQVSPNNDNFSVSVIDDPKASHFDFVNSETIWHESDHIFPNEALPIEMSRGCIFSCSFCSYPLNGKNKIDYLRDPGKLREELTRNYELYGTTEYIFCDDTHNDSVEKIEYLYDEVYSKLPFKIRFVTYLRLDLIAAKPHTAQLLLDSGLRGCFFGIESLNYESAKAIGKGIRPEQALKTLHWLKELWGDNVVTSAGFIVGLPHDTEETLNTWLNMITEPDFPIDSINVYPLGMPKDSGKKLWKSDLEKDPEKYGYHYPDPSKILQWSNTSTGLTYHRALELANETVARGRQNQKKSMGMFSIPGLLNMGYTYDEIKGCQLHEGALKDIQQRRLKMNKIYMISSRWLACI